MNLSQINTNTIEGRLLIAALTILTSYDSVTINKKPIQGTKTEPDAMLAAVNEFQEALFKDADPLPDNSVVVTQKTFVGELETLVNKYSKENLSDTPDFIIAKFLNAVLNHYGETVKARDRWFGVDMWKDKGDKGVSGTVLPAGRGEHTPAPVPDAQDQTKTKT